MEDIILVIIILAVVLASAIYIYKEKKKGNKCIGCPCSASCSKKNCNK